MIFDEVKALSAYKIIPHIDHVLKFLQKPDLSKPEIELRGRDLFVRVMKYSPKPAEQNKFETHQVYADIQVLLKGREIMQYARTQDLKISTDYDAKNDYQFFSVENNISDLFVHAGQFVIFLPGEAHRPSCQPPDYKGENLKLVFKVRMGQL